MRSPPRHAVAAALLALAACGGDPPPGLPDPDLAGADRPVAEAIRDGRAAALAQSGSAQAWGRLGMILDAHGLYADALACYKRAGELDRADVRYPYLAGLLLAMDDPAPATASLERAVMLDPRSAVIRHSLADALARAGRPADARRVYEEALRIDPDFRRSMLGLAELDLAEEKLKDAAARLKRAAEIEPCDREVHVKLARLYERLDEPSRAEREALLARAYPDFAPAADAIRAAVTAEARSAKAETLRGLDFVARGRYDEAEQAFRRALGLRKDVRHHLNLGGALVRQHRPAEALEHFRAALGLAPDDAEVRNGLAAALLESGDLVGAATQVRAALDLDAASDGALVTRGALHEREGETAEAIAAYRAAIEINPVNVPAHRQLAAVLWRQGERAEAIRHWREAIDLGCFDAESSFRAGVALAESGRFDESVELLRPALARAPSDEDLLAALATVLATCPDARVRNGREAAQLARRLIERHGPDHAPSLNLLAAALAETGDYAGAVTVADRALRVAREPGLHREITARLALYRAGRPYHQGAGAPR